MSATEKAFPARKLIPFVCVSCGAEENGNPYRDCHRCGRAWGRTLKSFVRPEPVQLSLFVEATP